MNRYYQDLLAKELVENRQMAFVSGARQVGKTTLSQQIAQQFEVSNYLNWDNIEHRQLILGDNKMLVEYLGLNQLRTVFPLLILDEIHKFSQWKQFLKGLFDQFSGKIAILVTGSARMDIFRKERWSLAICVP